MSDYLACFFQLTAWPMETPAAGSAFHILFACTGILSAILAALFLAGKKAVRPERLLFACGLLLALSELYKQGFLYFAVNGRRYNWWYFPFQL